MKGIHPLRSIENESIRTVLFIAFALIFTLPLLIFVFVLDQFHLLDQRLIQFSIAVSLTFSLLGLMLLRQLVDNIIAVSQKALQIIQGTTIEYSICKQNEMKTIAMRAITYGVLAMVAAWWFFTSFWRKWRLLCEQRRRDCL